MNPLTIQVTNIDNEGYASLLASDGTTRDDLQLTKDDTGAQIKKDFEKAIAEGKDFMVTVLGALGKEQIMSGKDAANT
jgi:translation initiation factor 5A